MKAALESARTKGADVRVVYKGFVSKVDSFGGAKYSEEYFGDRQMGSDVKADTAMGAHFGGGSAVDWTGAFGLLASNLDADLNAPPDVMAVYTRTPVNTVWEGKQRVFVA